MSLACSIQKSTCPGQFPTHPAQNALASASGRALLSLTFGDLSVFFIIHQWVHFLTGISRYESQAGTECLSPPEASSWQADLSSGTMLCEELHGQQWAGSSLNDGALLLANTVYYRSRNHCHGLVQERRNSSALAMELRLSCTKPSIFFCMHPANDKYCIL